MVEVGKDEVCRMLVDRGVRADLAKEYADLFCEYREAAANIDANGTIVQHPRTGNPITNPYLPIRDGALRKMKSMRKMPSAFLWE